MEIQITPKNLANKRWRMENLYKIKPKKGGSIDLKFNGVQQNILREIASNNLIKCPIRYYKIKARQQGVSTFWLIFWLDHTIFHKGQTTGILAHKNENLRYLMEIIRYAHQTMPDQLRPKLGDDSKTSLSFPDLNSKIFTSLSIRSTALQNLHISEMCFIKDLNIQATLGATNEQTTNITIESTGNGIGNYGHEFFYANNGYIKSFSPWFVQAEYRIPLNGLEIKHTKEENRLLEYAERKYNIFIDNEQILWRRKNKSNLRGMFPQEFPETEDDAFSMSGIGYFNKKKIMRLVQEARIWLKDVGVHKETEDEVYYEKPKTKCLYVAGADTSEGANDSSCLKIINVTERKEVYRFKARVGVDMFYKLCNERCKEFMNALLGVERNNHGHAVILGLENDCRYPNLFKEERKVPVIGSALPKLKTGWDTTKISKPVMCDFLRLAIEGNSEEDEDHFMPEITWYDTDLLNECLTFIEEKGKLEAITGKHDDNIIATAIAMQMYMKLRKFVQTDSGDKIDKSLYLGTHRESTI